MHPGLEVIDTCYSTRENLTYMAVINHTDEPITVKDGTAVAASQKPL